ncbi:MAG: exodeoxyribonuclease V subunit beta [Oceanospirillaceae bacterium]|nr:exodeoxyribonuclease V subunit beta [Oceanospirillaceae bacterium]
MSQVKAEVNEAQILDPISMPLTGEALIEASAGTGKTYTLAALYLRLLLGLGRESALEVGQILVVTFTEAATAELRERIRKRIQEARVAFILGDSDDPFIKQLLALHTDHARAVLDLEFAASEMDQAAIFTIHGFCQRMLKQHAFESGTNFNAQLISDDSDIIRQGLLDFWRNTLYQAPVSLANEILSVYATPEKLFSQIRGYLGLAQLQLSPDYSDFDLKSAWDEFEIRQLQLREALAKVLASDEPCDDLQGLIQSSSVDKRSYSKRNLPTWFAKLVAFSQGEKAPFKELLKFSQQQLIDKAKTDDIPRHQIFVEIEGFCAAQIETKAVVFCRALIAVRQNMQLEKDKQQLLSFDDLLQKLAAALAGSSGEMLAKAIRLQYPFALIDEFQDTDTLQYSIFSTLYSHVKVEQEAEAEQLGLLMIGDPKQSIYAFRGADIFTYIKARRQQSNHYTLATNWRSSAAMVNATNQLFSRSPAAFIYAEDIPFQKVAAGKSNHSRLTVAGQTVSAITFWQADTPLNSDQYLQNFATTCAAQIDGMLRHGEISGHPVTPANIAVLVRDRKEAALVQKALLQLQIDSVFMSNRDNIYTVNVARELQYILKAVNEPSNERALRTALATEIFQLSALELYALNQDELAWEALVEEFLSFRDIWWRSGVLAMLQALLQQRQFAQRWLSHAEGERRLTDYLHLAELLQQASAELESNEALIRFLQDRRAQPSGQSQEQQLRLDSDRTRITVITIHKSKGLEYDLVYLPFACRYRTSTSKLYHDDAGVAILDTRGGEQQDQVNKEQLAEDLRLLYVAITRAVQGCFIGMANVTLRNKSVWQKSAIGYLLTLIKEGGESVWLEGISISEALSKLLEQSTDIAVVNVEQIDLAQADLFAEPAAETSSHSGAVLAVRKFKRRLDLNWRLTSYSALSKDAQHAPALESAKLDLEVADEVENVESGSDEMSIFTFAKGAVAGTFLHSIYEEIDFTRADTQQIEEVLTQRLPLSGYDLVWLPCLTDFVHQSLQVKLAAEPAAASFSLSQIDNSNRLVEMEFVMPFKSIQAVQVNQLLREHDLLAKRAGDLVFNKVSGMLKGFIDLTVRVDNRYYVIDYKSNYLGDSASDYQGEALEAAMIDHRYDFQYVLYTLALHRLLRSRLASYDYDTHIGGVFYLFLRGLEIGSDSGVFFTKVSRELIDKLDNLFEGEA